MVPGINTVNSAAIASSVTRNITVPTVACVIGNVGVEKMNDQEADE
jgi:hypothetical protein